MMKIKHIGCLLCIAVAWTACDDGKIYPAEYTDEISGREVTLEANFFHIAGWPSSSSRQLVLAGYSDEDRTPLISVAIPQPLEEGGSVSLTLLVPDEVDRIAVVELNRTRLLLFQYYDYKLSGLGPVTLPVSEIDLEKSVHVQAVFNASCILCHGDNENAAAGLTLTAGKSFEALINKPAKQSSSGELLVQPGEYAQSFLHKVLNESDVVSFPHVSITTLTTPQKTSIDTWIGDLEEAE